MFLHGYKLKWQMDLKEYIIKIDFNSYFGSFSMWPLENLELHMLLAQQLMWYFYGATSV